MVWLKVLKTWTIIVGAVVLSGQFVIAQTPSETALLAAKSAVRQQNYKLAVEILSTEELARSPATLLYIFFIL